MLYRKILLYDLMLECLPVTRIKDVPMNYIFQVISKLLGNYRMPRVSGQGPLQRRKNLPSAEKKSRAEAHQGTQRHGPSCMVGPGVTFFFFFILFICIFFFHSWLWFKERDAESMNFDVY